MEVLEIKAFPNSLVVSSILNLSTSAQEIKSFDDRVRSDMKVKAIYGSITKKHLKKPRLHHGEYEWTEPGVS